MRGHLLPEQLAASPRSLVPGIAIVAGTAIGAGMFSLPVVSAGMWFSWSLLLLAATWFCMFHSSLLILETNLNFTPGASFNTFVKATLGPRWNTINNITLAFVLYLLTYAYISGGGSMVSHTLQSTLGISPPPLLAGIGFAGGLAFFVWFSTALVGRITAILLAGMLLTFLLSVGDLATHVDPALLLASEPGLGWYGLAAIPFFLTSFGYHGCVPSLVKYYGIQPRRIRRCLLLGSLLTLLFYSLWHLVTMGNIPRADFLPIIAAGGNIGDLVSALGNIADAGRIRSLLNAFANMAVVSSFLGVTLGLFDFVADKFGFDDNGRGRLQTALITFIPPGLGGLLFPDGFLYAIGLAGVCSCVWGTIVPALAARKSRQLYGSPHYRVWGGNGLVGFIIAYGLLLLSCYLLSALQLLPKLAGS